MSTHKENNNLQLVQSYIDFNGKDKVKKCQQLHLKQHNKTWTLIIQHKPLYKTLQHMNNYLMALILVLNTSY